MDRVERPLSPHLQVYRWTITMTLSILHRASGLALSLGALVLTWWLVALASGPAAYAQALTWLGAPWFKLLLFGWALCFFYHLANGIRHLVWDVGSGFEPEQIRASGWAVVVVTVVAAVGYALWAIV